MDNKESSIAPYVNIDRATRLTIEDGVALINQYKAKEDQAWRWILRFRWNVGRIATHLNTIYGKGTISNYAAEIGYSESVVYEAAAMVRFFMVYHKRLDKQQGGPKYDTPESFFEAFLTSGPPKKIGYVRKMVRKGVTKGILSPEDLVHSLLSIMEDNTRLLAAANDAAQSMPTGKREDAEAQIDGVESAYTDEALRYVQTQTNGVAGKTEDLIGYYVHTGNQLPKAGKLLGYGVDTKEARAAYLEKALRELGHHVTAVKRE